MRIHLEHGFIEYNGYIVYDNGEYYQNFYYDGIINYYNNSFLERWHVTSDCERVHITSSEYIGTPFDVLTIDGIDYPYLSEVNQVTSSSFLIYFSLDTLEIGRHANSRFNLSWACAQWGEWNQATDGTCNQERRPINNGKNTVGRLKYRLTNLSCRK